MSLLMRHLTRSEIIVFAVLAGAMLTAPAWIGIGVLRLVAEILFVFTMAQMWNLLAGYVGLVSLGHQAFVGIGAYTLFSISNSFGWSPFVCLPLAGIACLIVAGILAPFLFRLRDAYFSIAMWVFAEILRIMVSQSAFLGSVFGLPLKTAREFDRVWFSWGCYWSAVVLAFASVLVTLIALRMRLGLALISIRENDLAARSLGIDVWRAKFIAFLISAVGVGIAGAGFYMSSSYVDPTGAFDVNWAVIMLFIVVLGGIGTIEGPIVGTAVYFILRSVLAETGNWYLIGVGTIAVITIVVAPKGIWGALVSNGVELFRLRRTPFKELSKTN